MKKLTPLLACILFSCFCYAQTTDSAKIKRGTFDTYDDLRAQQAKQKIEKLTYLDSTFNFQVEIPNWLSLKETGSVYKFGGTMPAVDSIENAILIKIYNKARFPSQAAFKKYIVEDLTFGQTPNWSDSHKFMGKKDLGKYKDIGDSYKVYLLREKLMYHCEYILVETKSAYLWIDFTSTPGTFDKNISKFEEFMSGFKVTNF